MRVSPACDPTTREFLVGFWGLGWISTFGQVLLFREFWASFSGNELCFGIIMGSWLMWIGLGAAVGSRVSHAAPRIASLFLLFPMAMAALLPIEIGLARLLPVLLRIGQGEFASFGAMVVGIGLVHAPVAFLLGAGFPAGLSMSQNPPSGRDRVGLAFGLEALGSAAGALVFTDILAGRTGALESWSVCAGLFLLPCLILLNQPMRFVGLTLVLLAGLLVFWPLRMLREWDQTLTQKRWSFLFPGVRLLETRESPYQQLSLGDRDGQKLMTGNGALLFEFPDSFSVPGRLHGVLTFHPDPKRLLLLGGNIVDLSVEAMRYPRLNITAVDLDPEVLNLELRYSPPDRVQALDSLRFHPVFQDARRYLMGDETFDVILGSLPEPATSSLNRFTTREFFKIVSDSLTEGGIFSVTTSGAENYFAGVAGTQVATIWRTLRSVFPQVLAIPGEKTLFLCAKNPGLLISEPRLLIRRFEARQIASPYFNPAYFQALLIEERIQSFKRDLDRESEGPVNTDFRPLSVVTHLAMWSAFSGSGLERPLLTLSRQGPALPFVALVIAAGMIAIGMRRMGPGPSRSKASSLLILITTGASSMGLYLLSLFAVQSAYGYVYQEIGDLAATSMGGLALGALAPRRFSWGRRMLKLCNLAWIALLSLWPFALEAILGGKMPPGSGKALVFLFLFLGTALAGIQFPLASQRYAQAGSTLSAAGGWMDAADHLGAMAGALLIGLICVPVWGILAACWLLVSIKAASVLLDGRGSEEKTGPGRGSS